LTQSVFLDFVQRLIFNKMRGSEAGCAPVFRKVCT